MAKMGPFYCDGLQVGLGALRPTPTIHLYSHANHVNNRSTSGSHHHRNNQHPFCGNNYKNQTALAGVLPAPRGNPGCQKLVN